MLTQLLLTAILVVTGWILLVCKQILGALESEPASRTSDVSSH